MTFCTEDSQAKCEEREFQAEKTSSGTDQEWNMLGCLRNRKRDDTESNCTTELEETL